MNTPLADFVESYAKSGAARFHMPGHKGTGPLGCESWDITEIAGADALYEASGVIAESEANAGSLFGSARTLFSAEGSSQCIRAMLYLALSCRPAGTAPVIVAARNVHKAFVYAAALLDFTPVWLWPEEESRSLCGCPVSPEALEKTLEGLPAPPAAVYITSPDYLGQAAEIDSLANVCHSRGVPLLVDNAHGAYLRFLRPSRHPLDLGADLCCDSAHKTLPVLTGGAYLHIGKNAPPDMSERAKGAMALFGSTSPSYLIMASLDLCNRYLAEGYEEILAETTERFRRLKDRLEENGWKTVPSDPLRLTIDAASSGWTGGALAKRLRQGGVEPEYADPDFLVLMAGPANGETDCARVLSALGENRRSANPPAPLPQARSRQMLSPRQALFAPQESVLAETSLGRICGGPTVACPPAIPIAAAGERIGAEALALFRRYGVERVDVVKEEPHGKHGD